MTPIDSAIEKLLKINMGIQQGERVFVFTDHLQEGRLEKKEMERCRRLEEAADRVAYISGKLTETIFYKYDALPSNGYEPPEPVWSLAFGEAAIKEMKQAGILGRLISKTAEEGDIAKACEILSLYIKDMVDVIIAMSNFSTSHTRFRHLLTNIKGTRYASMPLFDPLMFSGPMDVDWNRIARRSKYIATLLTKAERAVMKTPAGTEITISLHGRNGHADTGLLTERGSFGNLPAGEVYIAPVEGSSEGILILEWSTMRRLSPPVFLKIKDGIVKEMEGDREFIEYLENIFSENPKAACLAELGIGTNDRALRPDNILEAEKILGTAHIAFGDNTTFGGNNSVSFHEDYVFFSPTLLLEYEDGTSDTIIEEGRLQKRLEHEEV